MYQDYSCSFSNIGFHCIKMCPPCGWWAPVGDGLHGRSAPVLNWPLWVLDPVVNLPLWSIGPCVHWSPWAVRPCGRWASVGNGPCGARSSDMKKLKMQKYRNTEIQKYRNAAFVVTCSSETTHTVALEQSYWNFALLLLDMIGAYFWLLQVIREITWFIFNWLINWLKCIFWLM